MAQANFRFVSDAVGGDQFTVTGFSGEEGVSTLYRYEIDIKAPVIAEIDLDDVLEARATFISEQNGTEYPVHGVLSSFEELRYDQHYSYYRAILVPAIWKLSNYRTNEIFYKAGEGNSIDEIISQVLEKAGMASTDFDLKGLSGKLLKREYVCQFNESDFDFISRLMENEGVFYYFEQSATQETIVIINDLNYLSIPRPKLLFDVAAIARQQEDCVHALSCRKQRLPENLIVRDYNPDEPSLDVSDITPIDSMGQGTEYIYGKNVHTDEEATYLSQIRAEELICRKTRYFGESSVSRLQAGYIFALDGHPNSKYNNVEFLATEVSHEGRHLDMSLSAQGSKDSKPQYQNSFVAIPADTQYRPLRRTPKPRITGTLHARIDGEQDSEHAQLDDQGRYKVSMPFDFFNENHPEGLASARVRMMQPYAGKNRGMQFPLPKGTDVLLSFIDGDPDRPIIAGAISTPSTRGPVNVNNQTESVIQTGGNNRIRMEDKAGSERVMFESPASNSWIRVGSKNDPVILNGSSPHYVPNDGAAYTDPLAFAHAPDNEAIMTASNIAATEIKDASGTIVNSVADMNTSVSGNRYYLKYVNGDDSAIRQVIVYDPADDDDTIELENNASDGIRIRSAGNLWLEAQSRYGNYRTGKPPVGPTKDATNTDAPSQIGDLLGNFGYGYNPTGLKNYKTGATQTLSQAMAAAHVHVSSLDTFTTQEGNIYDFGGYWNYNLGNSFAEEHIDQAAALNIVNSLNWPSAQLGDLSGAASGAISGAATTAVFMTYLTTHVTAAAAPHLWNAGGNIGNGFMVAGVVVLTAAAVGVGAAAGAGLGAIAPDGESFQGNVGDVIGGPGSGAIRTHANRVGSSFQANSTTTQNSTPEDDYNTAGNPGNAMHTDTTWVTKQFGDSYTYNRGNDISVRVGSTEDHHRGNSYAFVYGGTHEETKYNGKGRKVAWEKSGNNISQEAHWDTLSGLLTSYEYKNAGKFVYEGNFVTIPTLKISTSMSTVRGVVDASVGALDINVTGAAGIKIDVNLCAGLWVNMHAKGGGEADVNFVTMEYGFKSFGIDAQKKAAMKAEIQDVILEQCLSDIGQTNLKVSGGSVKMGGEALSVNSGMTFS